MKKTIYLIREHAVISVIIFAAVIFLLFFLLQKTKEKENTNMSASVLSGTYIIEGKKVTLSQGSAEISVAPGSATKEVVKYFGNEVHGDFNGDGYQDVVFLLTDDAGGSGTFYYVAAALGGRDGFQGTNAVFLGDRIAPQSTNFDDREIVVNYADRLPSEPMSAAPSHGVTSYFKIENGELVSVQNKTASQ